MDVRLEVLKTIINTLILTLPTFAVPWFINAVRLGIIPALGVVLLAWMLRYDVVAANTGGRAGTAYVLDRWTGAISFCSPSSCRPVTE